MNFFLEVIGFDHLFNLIHVGAMKGERLFGIIFSQRLFASMTAMTFVAPVAVHQWKIWKMPWHIFHNILLEFYLILIHKRLKSMTYSTNFTSNGFVVIFHAGNQTDRVIDSDCQMFEGVLFFTEGCMFSFQTLIVILNRSNFIFELLFLYDQFLFFLMQKFFIIFINIL